jgi:hypothetical protein
MDSSVQAPILTASTNFVTVGTAAFIVAVALVVALRVAKHTAPPVTGAAAPTARPYYTEKSLWLVGTFGAALIGVGFWLNWIAMPPSATKLADTFKVFLSERNVISSLVFAVSAGVAALLHMRKLKAEVAHAKADTLSTILGATVNPSEIDAETEKLKARLEGIESGLGVAKAGVLSVLLGKTVDPADIGRALVEVKAAIGKLYVEAYVDPVEQVRAGIRSAHGAVYHRGGPSMPEQVSAKFGLKISNLGTKPIKVVGIKHAAITVHWIDRNGSPSKQTHPMMDTTPAHFKGTIAVQERDRHFLDVTVPPVTVSALAPSVRGQFGSIEISATVVVEDEEGRLTDHTFGDNIRVPIPFTLQWHADVVPAVNKLRDKLKSAGVDLVDADLEYSTTTGLWGWWVSCSPSVNTVIQTDQKHSAKEHVLVDAAVSTAARAIVDRVNAAVAASRQKKS